MLYFIDSTFSKSTFSDSGNQHRFHNSVSQVNCGLSSVMFHSLNLVNLKNLRQCNMDENAVSDESPCLCSLFSLTFISYLSLILQLNYLSPKQLKYLDSNYELE